MLEPVQVNLDGIGWVICGGETVKSGQKNDDGTPAIARFMDPDWRAIYVISAAPPVSRSS